MTGTTVSFQAKGVLFTEKGAEKVREFLAGQSTDIGFNGSHTGTNTNPTSFTLNGATCAVA